MACFSGWPSAECPGLCHPYLRGHFDTLLGATTPSWYTQAMAMSIMPAYSHDEGCAEYCACEPPPVYSRTPSGSGSGGHSRRPRYDAREAAVRGRRRRSTVERNARSRMSEVAWPDDAPSRAKLLTYSFEGKLAYVPAAASHEVRIRCY